MIHYAIYFRYLPIPEIEYFACSDLMLRYIRYKKGLHSPLDYSCRILDRVRASRLPQTDDARGNNNA